MDVDAETGKKVSELVGQLPTYHIVKDKHEVERDRLPALFTSLTAAIFYTATLAKAKTMKPCLSFG